MRSFVSKRTSISQSNHQHLINTLYTIINPNTIDTTLKIIQLIGAVASELFYCYINKNNAPMLYLLFLSLPFL